MDKKSNVTVTYLNERGICPRCGEIAEIDEEFPKNGRLRGFPCGHTFLTKEWRMNQRGKRSPREIALEILRTGFLIPKGEDPLKFKGLVEKMSRFGSLDQEIEGESGREVMREFAGLFQHWRGPRQRELKEEIDWMLKGGVKGSPHSSGGENHKNKGVGGPGKGF